MIKVGVVSEELENAYYDSIKTLQVGEIVKGKIVSANSRGVVVDVGYKSEGIIPRYEFSGVEDFDSLKEVEVYVDEVEDEDGKLILSYTKAQEAKGWQKLNYNSKEGDLVEGFIIRRVKGGYIVNVFGVEGFLPQSLSMFRGVSKDVIGQKFYFQIVKMNRLKQNFIVSRKEAIRLERDRAREKVWGDMKVGQIRKGKVKSITNFGAFIDLGGVDGLLHITDMSWKKISHPSEIVAVGNDIGVMVLGFDREKGRISLGLKQTISDPWEEIDTKYPVGSTIKGQIVNIKSYGLFVELEKGIEGLIHISEISWAKKFIVLSDSFAIGDMVEAKVIGVDSKNKKISLSARQIEPDPWDDIENNISLDSIVKGKVVGFGEHCAYIELDNSLDGIIYNEDFSWTKKVRHPQDIVIKPHSYEFKVLGLDRANRRIILGVKQIGRASCRERV